MTPALDIHQLPYCYAVKMTMDILLLLRGCYLLAHSQFRVWNTTPSWNIAASHIRLADWAIKIEKFGEFYSFEVPGFATAEAVFCSYLAEWFLFSSGCLSNLIVDWRRQLPPKIRFYFEVVDFILQSRFSQGAVPFRAALGFVPNKLRTLVAVSGF